jgi:4-amino-4-deoxy-L-arabinose transferase-like glycosyltransferase
MFELFGESRLTLGIWPLAASMMSASLIAVIGNRLFQSPVGWLAAVIFVATPAFSIQIIGPSAEAVELMFLLGGTALIIEWLDQKSKWTAFGSGLCFALAFQVKETSLTAAVIAGIYVLTRRPRFPDVLMAAVGFAGPFVIECIVYSAVTGDAFYRRNLSLAHTQIPSTELQRPIDRQSSPIFNRSIISSWRREPGVHVHWTLDGIINLLANAKAGLTLWLAPLGLLVLRPVLTVQQRKAAWALLGCAFLYIVILVFVFAVDPKPRMMFAPLAASAMALAVIIIAAWNAERRMVPLVMLGAHLLVSTAVLFNHPRTNVFDAPANAWITRLGGTAAVDRNTSRHLAMIPLARELPGLETNRPFWIRLSLTGCGASNSVRNVAGRRYELVSVQPSSQPSLPGVKIPLELCVFRQVLE